MQVYGLTIDNETRCVHYHSPLDIVALQCAQCRKFYPCYECHNTCESHPFAPWRADESAQHAILCGHCQQTLSIAQYRTVSACPHCNAPFNPNCSKHYHLYFAE